jgi:endonuclease YncB( thermonuclease family)
MIFGIAHSEYAPLTRKVDEDNARSKKLGLWGGSHKPIAPWDWQKLSKEERDEFR